MTRRFAVSPAFLIALVLSLSMAAPGALAAAPANDDYGSAEGLTGASGSASGTTVESTFETGEHSFFNDVWETTGDVWYSWTAPASGFVAFRTTNIQADSDTVLAAETGSDITSLSTVTYNDDYEGLSSRILFNAVSGTTYSIGVGPYLDATDEGTFTLEWGASDYYDDDLPRVSASGRGGKNSLTVTFSASDETNTQLGGGWLDVECSVDGGAYSACTSPNVTSSLAGGLHTWSVRATDGAANIGSASGQTRVKGPKKNF